MSPLQLAIKTVAVRKEHHAPDSLARKLETNHNVAGMQTRLNSDKEIASKRVYLLSGKQTVVQATLRCH